MGIQLFTQYKTQTHNWQKQSLPFKEVQNWL